MRWRKGVQPNPFEVIPSSKVERTRAVNQSQAWSVLHGRACLRAQASSGSLGQESDVQRYLVFEDEGHDVLKMKNRVVCYGKTREFFASRLKNA